MRRILFLLEQHPGMGPLNRLDWKQILEEILLALDGLIKISPVSQPILS